MALFSRFAGGGKRHSPADLINEAEAFLLAVEQEVLTNCKSAMSRIMKRPKHLEPVFDFGAALHERFGNVVLQGIFLKKKGGAAQRTCNDLPSVKVITDREVTTVGEALALAAASDEETVFLRFVKDWPADVLAALEAVYELAVDPAALFLIHAGPDNVFVRRNFLLTAGDAMGGGLPLQKAAEKLFLYGEKQEGVDYDDCVVSAYGYAFCKFFRKNR